MTQEQAKRLCELEPEHFKWRGQLLWSEYGIFTSKFGGEIYWWMLKKMPDVVLCAPIMDGNWMCDDSRLERYGASRETPEEAVISAYIEWLESWQAQ